MANQTITQLPTAGPITGSELVPIVQNGGTYKTTAAALAGSPVQTQTFLTLTQEPTLNNSRYLSAGTGVGLTDGGAQSFYRISLNGVSGTLETMGNGFGVNVVGTMTPRSITYSGSGITVANQDGQSGNPTIALTGTVASLANSSGTGFLALPGNGTVSGRIMTGTADQIDVSNPDGVAGNPTFGIAENAVFPGVEGVTVPAGTTDDRPSLPNNGEIRYNTDLALFEGYLGGSWQTFSSGGSGVTSIATGTGLTGGPITSTGTISIDSTVVTLTGAQTLTNKTLTSPTISNPAITGTVKLTGTGASAYTPFIQTFSSSVVNYNGYQLNYIQNVNNGSDASSDYVIYNDASDVESYFADFGLNSSNYSSPTYQIFTPNSAYLFTGGGSSGQSASLFFGTSNAASDIVFFTGGTLLANTRATIKGSGNFLIGTSTDTGYKLNVNGTTYFGGASTFGSTVLLNADPTLALQAATKQYVDNATSNGFHVHEPVLVATTGNLTATYSNGTLGVGATLTNSGAQAALSIDGVSMSVNDRILVWQQTSGLQNGVYVVTTVGDGSTNWVLTRSADANTSSEGDPNSLGGGDYFFVQSGATLAYFSFICVNTSTITFGTTAIEFNEFSSVPIYTGSAPISVAGQVISLTGTVAATNGGTGTATVATGDLLYGSATDTWSKLPIGVAYKSLIVNASGTQVEWNAIPLNQATAVSGSLNVANGGTGVGTLTGLVFGNGTSAFTAATGAEIVAAIGSSAVTNATNVATTATSTDANFFIPFVALSTTGNQGLGVDAGITYNPSTNALTASINGGTF